MPANPTDPNWGMSNASTTPVTDPKDPNWGLTRPPDFKTTNEPPSPAMWQQALSGTATFLKEAASQLNPITASQGAVQAVAHPVETVKALGKAQGALYDKAKAAYEKGDYVGATAHFLNYLLPVLGPQLDVAGEQLRSGETAKGLGTTVGIAGGIVAPEVAARTLPAVVSATTRPVIRPSLTPQEAAAVKFGQAQGVPIDAATATGNRFVRGVQRLADESMLGQSVGEQARATQAQALSDVAERQAQRVTALPTTPETAGQELRDVLTSKVQAHNDFANAQYDKLRAIEANRPDAMMVDVTATKQALKPVYEQLRRQMPITQQQASPGLKALQNVLEGPDSAPLSQIDRDLSAIKTIAREQGGVAKLAVQNLDAAVKRTAAAAGPDAALTLQSGRQAIIAREATKDLLDTIRTEPVQAFRQMTLPKDSGIERLRTVAQQAPTAVPAIARGYLEDLFSMATAEGGFGRAARLQAEWQKLGPETKKILFPQQGQVQALDNFFLLAKRIAENPNPSGSALTWVKGGEMAGWISNPLAAVPTSIGARNLSKLLHSPAGVKALTQGLTMQLSPGRWGTAAQATAVGNLLKAAEDAGLSRDDLKP